MRLLLQLDKQTEAEALLNTLAGKQQDNPNYWHLRGQWLSATDKDDEAIDAYRKAIALDPRYAQPFIALYNYALQASYVDVFISEARAISQSDPSNLLARNLLAQYLFFTRNFDEAMPMYAALVEEPNLLNPAQAYNRLAIMALEDSLEDAAAYLSLIHI